MSGRAAAGRGLVVALSLACAAVSPAAAGATSGPGSLWSSPARPPGCAVALPTAAPPLVVFPTSAPAVGSGPGRLLWIAPRGCARGAATGEIMASTIGADARPGKGRALAGAADRLSAVAAAAGTATGQLVVVGRGAVASAYLGDVALATPVRAGKGWAIAVRVQRHYEQALGPARLVPAGPSPVTALAVALDYRAEILLVWADRGAIYARELSSSGGATGPAHRLASLQTGAPAPEVGALLSDDGHAIVAWRTQSPPGAAAGHASGSPAGASVVPAGADGGSTTTVSLAISGAGLAWAPPHTLERFRDPGGFVPPVGSMRLVRLSSEAVMLAWTGVREGRYAVLVSPVSLRRGAWAPVAISQASAGAGTAPAAATSSAQEALLSDIAPGPDAEAVAVWRAAPRLPDGAPDLRHATVDAARGHYAGQGEVSFDVPEPVAPAGADGPPVVAIDPASGNAMAAWVSVVGGLGQVEYALRIPELAGSPPATPAPAAAAGTRRPRDGGGSRAWIAAVAVGALVLVLSTAGMLVAARRPRRVRARRGL